MSREIRPDLYINDSGLTKFLKTTIAIVIFCGVVLFLAHAVQLVALGAIRQKANDDEAVVYSQLYELSGVVELVAAVPMILVAIVSAILFLKWFGRSNHNLSRAMGERLEFTPSGCIWAFFLPIVNLWWPVRAMTEVIRASEETSTETGTALERLVTQWWFVFWISSAAGRLASRLGLRAETIDDQYYALIATVVSDGLDIAQQFLSFWVVSGIYKSMRAKAVSDGIITAPDDTDRDGRNTFDA
jgi:hypothetical protein